MRSDALEAVLAAGDGPGLLVASAGEINTGSFDPIAEIVALAKPLGYWCHVDGAFGLWAGRLPAAAAPDRRHRGRRLVGHRLPQDAAVHLRQRGGAVRPPGAHHAAMTTQAAYTRHGSPTAAARRGDPWTGCSGMARRARGRAGVGGAALAGPGRRGRADLALPPQRGASWPSWSPPARGGPGGQRRRVQPGAAGRRPGAAVRPGHGAVRGRGRRPGPRGRRCWLGDTRWRGRPMLRVSIANWQTTPAHVERLGGGDPARGAGDPGTVRTCAGSAGGSRTGRSGAAPDAACPAGGEVSDELRVRRTGCSTWSTGTGGWAS